MKARRCGPLYGRRNYRRFGLFVLHFGRRHKWEGWTVVRLELAEGDYIVKPAEFHQIKELFMRKLSSGQIKKVASMIADLRGFERLPNLRDFLTDPKLELDGVEIEREPGSVYFQARGDVFAVTLKEPSQGLLMRIEVPSIAALLPTIEAALGDSGSMWEADPWARKKPKGKKKGGC